MSATLNVYVRLFALYSALSILLDIALFKININIIMLYSCGGQFGSDRRFSE